MTSIVVHGSLDPPRAEGVEYDDTRLYKIACAQVYPSEDGTHGQGGLDKLEAYAKEAASRGADGESAPR